MMTTRKLLILLVLVCVPGCSDHEKARLEETTKPTYDAATGRLKELTYDANKDGRIDTWTEMDGTRPLRSRIDRNGDGRIDRWEIYDDRGQLAKVGFSWADDGRPDAWAFPGPDGKVHRIEISSSGDENRIDRWEYYEPSVAGLVGRGALVRAEEDTNGDGVVDKWETYEDGAIKTAAFDESGDGRTDRRLTYKGAALAVIESHPDASGRFTRRVEVKQER